MEKSHENFAGIVWIAGGYYKIIRNDSCREICGKPISPCIVMVQITSIK